MRQMVLIRNRPVAITLRIHIGAGFEQIFLVFPIPVIGCTFFCNTRKVGIAFASVIDCFIKLNRQSGNVGGVGNTQIVGS